MRQIISDALSRFRCTCQRPTSFRENGLIGMTSSEYGKNTLHVFTHDWVTDWLIEAFTPVWWGTLIPDSLDDSPNFPGTINRSSSSLYLKFDLHVMAVHFFFISIDSTGTFGTTYLAFLRHFLRNRQYLRSRSERLPKILSKPYNVIHIR